LSTTGTSVPAGKRELIDATFVAHVLRGGFAVALEH